MLQRSLASFVALSMTVTAQVVPNGAGKVEFIGLEEWTPTQIRDRLTGGRDVGAWHYCAASLEAKVGMAAASVAHYRAGDGPPYVVVTVVEPGRKDRVRYLPAIAGETPPIEEWRELAGLLDGHGIGAQLGVLYYPTYVHRGREVASKKLAEGRADAERLWSELELHDTAESLDRALWTLARDPAPRNRFCAAAILMNFADRDIAWWTLAEGLRDSDSLVRSMCGQCLAGLVRGASRPVDWQPVARSLRHILAGTNLFAFEPVLRMLRRTEVSPELATELLADNGHLVLAYLRASYPRIRQSAREFLVAIRGKDLGDDTDLWQQWIDGLPSQR